LPTIPYPVQTNTNTACPILLSYGDSLTHGKHPHRTFADPLWEVDVGQNSIMSHTVLQERLALTLRALYPDYVLILIGTNDVRVMVRPKTWGKYIAYIKRLPAAPTLQNYQNNVQLRYWNKL
jgi:lysophospholipase L1-like esterase